MKYLLSYRSYVGEQMVLETDIDLDKEFLKLKDDEEIYYFNKKFFKTLFDENKIKNLEDNYRIVCWQKLEE